jgi:hypothetical protein
MSVVYRTDLSRLFHRLPICLPHLASNLVSVRGSFQPGSITHQE